MIIQSRRSALLAAIATLAALGGVVAAVHYHRLGLTLSHYDSRGHLIVARRIADSITPGWQQIGAVWLPLPHLLNFFPVQVDALYRSGASAVAISVGSFVVATTAIAWIVLELSGSALGALAAAAAFASNPNVLYLQATPMTEPLQLALTTSAIALLLRWLNAATGGVPPGLTPVGGPTAAGVGWAFAAAALTRYEAWTVTIAALLAAILARSRHGDSWSRAARRVAPIAIYPAAAATAFVIFSRIVIGRWFVSSGFFVPENKALGRPLVAMAEIGWGALMLSGYLTMAVAAAGLIALLVASVRYRARADGFVALSLLAVAALPWAAFLNGHPFRIRYMVPLLAIQAVGVGAAVGTIRRLRPIVFVLVVGVVAYELRPLDASAPMVVEAQWDRPNTPARQQVTDCLRRTYGGEKIMASMASLGHYMQQTAQAGFALGDFLHEGNGDIWLAALHDPRPFVGWLMIEEKANGGDMLARIARENPRFLDGFSRICDGAGLALYQRQNRTLTTKR